MQKLTLQFEGFAQTGHSIDDKAPATEVRVENPAAEKLHDAVAAIVRLRSRVRTWVQAHSEDLEDTAMGTALMGAGVFILWLAAVLQGGAA